MGRVKSENPLYHSTGLLALLANGNPRRQFREQFPDEYATLCERSLCQNGVESGFSQGRCEVDS